MLLCSNGSFERVALSLSMSSSSLKSNLNMSEIDNKFEIVKVSGALRDFRHAQIC